MLSLGLLLAALALDPAETGPAKERFAPEKFRTLVDPDCSYCHVEAKRGSNAPRPDDRVLAWIRGQHDGGAIPYRWFLIPYRVISDSYGVFVYDPDAGFVRGWPASYDFRFHGWRNGVMVMSHKDGTLFDCLTGKAFAGPRKGEELTPLPTMETDWGPWLKSQPGTVAYTMYPKFTPSAPPEGVLSESRRTRPAPDPRLDPEERVFGLAVGKASQAWPLKTFGKERSARAVKVGDQEAVILWEPSTRTAVAFAPETEGKSPGRVTLTTDASDPSAPWVDRETGSRWSLVGRAVSGPRKGASLRWLPGVQIKWYAWAAEYPGTGL
jgi:hypothetical protein